MSNPIEPDQAPEVVSVDPATWLNRQVEYDDKKWVITSADFALSYLPRRDGQPGKAPYKRVLEISLESMDPVAEGGGPETRTAYLCVLCDFMARSARAVASHQKVEHAETEERAPRVHFPADFRDMTIDELRDMHRGYQAMAERLRATHEVLVEERRQHRETIKGLETIRRVLNPKPASN